MMTTRRDVLKTAGLVGGAGLLGLSPSLRAAAAPAAEGRIHFSTQTNAYPIDPKDFNTFLKAMAELKAIGFEGFETGYRNVMSQFAAPEEARAKIAATGLTFLGVHIFLGPGKYDPGTLIAPSQLYEQVVQGAKPLGARYLFCSGQAAETTAQLKSKVAGLNAAGAFCKSQGMSFAYHNEEPESKSPLHELDVLYTETDPGSVKFLFDVGHLFNVGGDVVAFIRKYNKRLAALHLRDYRDHEQVVLGTGTLPLAEIAHTLEAAHWEGWVETEEERLDGVKHGDEYLKPAYAAMRAAFRA